MPVQKQSGNLLNEPCRLVALPKLKNSVCPTILPIDGVGEEIITWLSQEHYCKRKLKQTHLEFEIGLMNPFSWIKIIMVPSPPFSLILNDLIISKQTV